MIDSSEPTIHDIDEEWIDEDDVPTERRIVPFPPEEPTTPNLEVTKETRR